MSYDGTVAGSTSYITQIATMAVVEETDPAFLTILPQMISYAENRMYRDIDFMFTSTSLHGASFVLTPGNRNLSFNINLSSNSDAATGTFVVSEQINLLTGPPVLNVTGASGNGTNATLTYSSTYVFSAGQTIVVSGMVPSGYNGTYLVVNSSAGSVSYASTTTGSMTTAGTIDGSSNASTTNDPDLCARTPLLPTTKEFLDAVYGSSFTANRAAPKYFVPFNETLFFVGPVPDQAYPVEVVGTYRPNSLGYMPAIISATTGGNITFASNHGLTTGQTIWLSSFSPTAWNGSFTVTVTGLTTVTVSTSATTATTVGSVAKGASTTFISLYLPETFIMASMIYVSAYQRNFGRANDDPQMAVSYESQYQALLKSAVIEEARKKFDSSGWSSQSPATIATPSRG